MAERRRRAATGAEGPNGTGGASDATAAGTDAVTAGTAGTAATAATAATADAVEHAFRGASGQALATVARWCGSIDLAEEAVQDAFAEALRTWPTRGVPRTPGAWITTTARNRLLDRLRRESRRSGKEEAATRELAGSLGGAGGGDALDTVGDLVPVPDDQLRLIFTCCHPALSVEARIALTLRLVCGLSTAEIARAFLQPEPTISQRLTRAKRRIRDTGIALRLPPAERLGERLPSVLACIYLVFREGYAATAGEVPVRAELCVEASRLAQLVVELLPDEPEALGLLALVLYQDARRPARLGPGGEVVLLEHQDRGRWDRTAIGAADDALRRAGRADVGVSAERGTDPQRPADTERGVGGRPLGPYQLQAAIAAEHAHAASWQDTDWRAIRWLYDRLLEATPTPVVQLNRAIAISYADGPDAGLVALAEVADEPSLARSAALPATRADLLRRLGRADEARIAYDQAVALAGTAAERALLERRRDAG